MAKIKILATASILSVLGGEVIKISGLDGGLYVFNGDQTSIAIKWTIMCYICHF